MTPHEAMMSSSNQIRHDIEDMRGFLSPPTDPAPFLERIISESERLISLAKRMQKAGVDA